MQKNKTLPAIISDIDGVLYSGGALCGNSSKVTSDILTKKFRGSELPFLLVTNGGMMTE